MKKKHGSATQTNVKMSTTGSKCNFAPVLQCTTFTALQTVLCANKLARGFEGQVKSIPG